METRRILILNKMEQLEKVQLFIDELAESWTLKPELFFEINLILEEYITNLIGYGYHDEYDHEIAIEISIGEKQIKIIVTDDAGPFDITKVPENTDIDNPVEERKIGGLGIHLIKKFTDQIEYDRIGKLNRLIMLKNLQV